MNGLTMNFGFFRSPFDRLSANGKILNLMAVTLQAWERLLRRSSGKGRRASAAAFPPTPARGNDSN